VVSQSVDELVRAARARIERVSPRDAWRQASQGALLVDIRPERQRAEHGAISQALIVERNVLEWRFDPTGAWHIEEVSGYERPIIVLCQEGYASSLAADSLRAVGHTHVADMIGGFAAWRAEGLPVAEGQRSSAQAK
jgi:rhodanese-related sulfurtransferase